MEDKPTFRRADAGDQDTVLALAREFWRHSGLAASGGRERALAGLLGAPEHGEIHLIAITERAIGYGVLCWGYSVEIGGRDAFLDELYIRRDFRGAGIGARALEYLEAVARAAGVKALHLELMDDNRAAGTLYRRAGYVERASHLLSKRLD